MRVAYYPTFDEAYKLLNEKLDLNIVLNEMYNIPAFYPLNEEARFHLMLLNVSNVLSSDIFVSWSASNTYIFIQRYNQLTGRNLE